MLTEEQINDKKYLVFLPLLLYLLCIVLFIMSINSLLDDAKGIFAFLIVAILISIVMLFLCVIAFKNIFDLNDNNELSFGVIIAGILDIIVFICNIIVLCYAFYLLCMIL